MGRDKPPSGPRWILAPEAAVAGELGRALLQAAILPVHLFDYSARREALRAELLADLRAEPAFAPDEIPLAAARKLPRRPLRVFLSCAEASGELHALHLLDALRTLLQARGLPPPEVIGLGGSRLAHAGVRLSGMPVQRAAMGFDGLATSLPYYLGLLRGAARTFATAPPDVCAAVDSPALHVPLLRMARRFRVPAVHFVAPQHWGWAPWRAAAYGRGVDRVLTILPFEPAWFSRRGIATVHVGHPLLDALPPREDPAPEPRPLLALLPGSRAGVIERNLPWMLRVARRLRARLPGLEVAVAHDDELQARALRERLRAAGAEPGVRVEQGLHPLLARAGAALSVSGTVLLDVLHQRVPAVVIYRLRSARQMWMYRRLLTAPWFASPNLLAGREVFPERCFRGDGPLDEVVELLLTALTDTQWRRRCLEGMERAAQRLGPPGACRRAAVQVLAAAAEGHPGS